VPDYLSTADWSGHMLAHCLDNIDMLSEHYYSSSDMHTDLKLEKKVNIGPQLCRSSNGNALLRRRSGSSTSTTRNT
jgi:hypothetical protein